MPSLNNASHAAARVIAGAASASEAAAAVAGGGGAAAVAGGGGAAAVAGGGGAPAVAGGGGAPAVAGEGDPVAAPSTSLSATDSAAGSWGADGAALVEDGLEAGEGSALDIAREVGGSGEGQG